MSETLWAIVPALDLVDLTLQTCADLLAQSIPVRVLLIDQGSSEESNDAFRALAEAYHPRVLLWSYTVPLPSLSAAWNLGLRHCWALGADAALVVNSDVRLWRGTAETLCRARAATTALFVTALGVGEQQYHNFIDNPLVDQEVADLDLTARGGPDFSCFLITREGHARHAFDEGFIPAFGEDCDAHRRYMLGGDGNLIFSVNLPFHHIGGGSRTINQSKAARDRFERQAGIGRAHYRAKWGGPPNQETFIQPFLAGRPVGILEGVPDDLGVTNPELQARVQAGVPPLGVPPLGVPPPRELSGAEEIAAVEAAFRVRMEAIRQREAEASPPFDPEIPF